MSTKEYFSRLNEQIDVLKSLTRSMAAMMNNLHLWGIGNLPSAMEAHTQIKIFKIQKEAG